jgi:hypothetical protein
MSQPLRKRPRQETNSDPESGDPTSGTSTTMMSTTATSMTFVSNSRQMKETIKDVMNKLNDSLDALESCSDRSVLPTLLGDASMEILQLKVLQQRVLTQTRITQSLLTQLSVTRDEQELQLQNLMYQQSLNKAVTESAEDLESTALVELVLSVKDARKVIASDLRGEDETSMVEDDDEKAEDDTTATASQQDLIRDFLGGDPKNPNERTNIVLRLNQEVANRQRLAKEGSTWRQTLAQAKKIKAAKTKLIGDLPQRLAEMEKASLPLQKFCQKSLDVTQKLGTQRRQRLDHAAMLPKALYTLFYQLHASLDIIVSAASVVSELEKTGVVFESDSLPVVDVSLAEGTSAAVVLEIPIPTIRDLGTVTYQPKTTAAISFQYNDQADMVFARCTTSENDAGSLISELFPGDTGEWNPHNTQDGTTPPIGSNISSKARPYHWCSYLAGLHVAPGEQIASKMHLSAKVVIDALMRRSRAMATLKLILECLSIKSHPIPVHSSMKTRFESGGGSSNGNTLKIAKWTAVDRPKEADASNSSSKIRIYEATLKDTSSLNTEKGLMVRIRINMARYPSIPPQFQIASTQQQQQLSQSPSWEQPEEVSLMSLQSGRTPLYNELLARLEKHVNRDVHQLVTSSDETSYDWILAHQMAELAKSWKDILQDITTATSD